MSINILAIEDEPLDRQLMGRSLQRVVAGFSYNLIWAESLSEATERLDGITKKDSLIISTDMKYPAKKGVAVKEEDAGIGFFLEMKKRGLSTPLIIHSSDPEIKTREMFEERGLEIPPFVRLSSKAKLNPQRTWAELIIKIASLDHQLTLT